MQNKYGVNQSLLSQLRAIRREISEKQAEENARIREERKRVQANKIYPPKAVQEELYREFLGEAN